MMKIYKFLFNVALITVLAVGYVHQKVSTVRLSYEYQKNYERLTELLDQNRLLIYNVSNLKSPAYLERTLAASNVSLVLPSLQQVVKVEQPVPSRGIELVNEEQDRNNRFIEFLIPSAEAEE